MIVTVILVLSISVQGFSAPDRVSSHLFANPKIEEPNNDSGKLGSTKEQDVGDNDGDIMPPGATEMGNGNPTPESPMACKCSTGGNGSMTCHCNKKSHELATAPTIDNEFGGSASVAILSSAGPVPDTVTDEPASTDQPVAPAPTETPNGTPKYPVSCTCSPSTKNPGKYQCKCGDLAVPKEVTSAAPTTSSPNDTAVVVSSSPNETAAVISGTPESEINLNPFFPQDPKYSISCKCVQKQVDEKGAGNYKCFCKDGFSHRKNGTASDLSCEGEDAESFAHHTNWSYVACARTRRGKGNATRKPEWSWLLRPDGIGRIVNGEWKAHRCVYGCMEAFDVEESQLKDVVEKCRAKGYDTAQPSVFYHPDWHSFESNGNLAAHFRNTGTRDKHNRKVYALEAPGPVGKC